MKPIVRQIIDLILEHDLSTADFCDAMGRKGWLKGVIPLNRGHRVIGQAEFIYAAHGSNWSLRQQLADIEPGKLVFCHGFDTGARAVFGEKVCRYLIEVKGAPGIIINGMVRDVHIVYERNLPVWAAGVTPIGCSLAKPQSVIDPDVVEQVARKIKSGLVIADDTGVALCPDPDQTFLDNLQRICEREKILQDQLSLNLPPFNPKVDMLVAEYEN